MKNITDIIRKGTLTPKERVIIQMKDSLQYDKTGTHIFSQADRYALKDGWKPQYQQELSDYNMYLQGAGIAHLMNLSSMFVAYEIQLRLSNVIRLLDYTVGQYAQDLLDIEISESELYRFMSATISVNYDQLISNHPELKEEIKILMSNQTLEIKSVEHVILNQKRTTVVIIGQSIFKLPDTHILKQMYIKEITPYIPVVRYVLMMQEIDILRDYGDLLALSDIYKKLVDIYGVEVDYQFKKSLEEIEKYRLLLNTEMTHLIVHLQDDTEPSISFYELEIDTQKFLFKIPEKNYVGILYTNYHQDFVNIFPYEFTKL